MKKLNERELVCLFVARDLFLKGTPEQRVAEYCLLKGMTPKQIKTFLEKIPLPETIREKIYTKAKVSPDIDIAKMYGRDLDFFIKGLDNL